MTTDRVLSFRRGNGQPSIRVSTDSIRKISFRMKEILFFLCVLLLGGCVRNHPPLISSLSCNPATRSAGTTFTLEVAAGDEDGDPLVYQWSATDGTFLDTMNLKKVRWKSPVSGSGITYTLTVTVSDGKNEVAEDYKILLGEPQFGSVSGTVSFTNFKIPIPEATVTIGDQSDLTDSKGFFFISGIPVDNYTLLATKPDYSTQTANIRIAANDTLGVSLEITSVNNTTKLSGMLSDPVGKPVEYAKIVVLNPDGTESKLKSTTDANGYYRLWYIPHGERTIRVSNASTEDYSYISFEKVIVCEDIDTQLDLVIKTITLKGEFTDPRDQQVYRFKTLGSTTWMTENLAYLPRVYPSSATSVAEDRYYVYDYQGTDSTIAPTTENYKKYGVLYNRPAALLACPPGWHLPSIYDWNYFSYSSGPGSGIKLKSTSGWKDRGDGNNTSGMSVFPGGKVDEKGNFTNVESAAYLWTSTIRQKPLYVGLYYNSDELYDVNAEDKMAFSIRCARNN